MSLILPKIVLSDTENNDEIGDKSPLIRSSSLNQSILHRPPRLKPGRLIDIPTDLSDDENDFNDSISVKENSRFASKIIRTHHSRQNSFKLATTQQRHFSSSTRKTDPLVIQAPPPGTITISPKDNSLKNDRYKSIIDNQTTLIAGHSLKEIRGQTFLHLAASLGHDEILRLLISETSQSSMLINKNGQTPLLTAIEAGSTSTATLLMEADPRSIIASDMNGSSVYHYACEHCNDVVLHRAIGLSKRLNSNSDRLTVNI
jgi:hypothetical protein